MLPSETMIWQPEFTDKTLSRKPGAVQIEATPKPSCQLVSSATSHEHRNINIQINSLIEKHSSELAKVSGAKEIYEELIVAVPSRENEFRKLSLEQEKKHIKKNEKINTLIGIINQSVAIMQCVLTSI
uniref:hypothetical protein n=2 Tax=Escherichia coli TaxID=562 RepID=UPI001FCEABE6